MTIASEIERLQNVRTDIYDELGSKCVNLDGSSKYADVAPIIKKMPVVCAKIGANKYPVVKIGNQLWTAKNLDEDLGTIGTNEWYYNGRTEKTRVNVLTSLTMVDSSISTIFQFYDWEDGHVGSINKKASIPLNRTINICFTLNASSTIPTAKSFTLYADTDVAGTVNLGNFSLPANTSSLDFSFSYTFKNGATKIWNLRFSSAKVGVDFTFSNLRMCYGSADCGTNAIDVPTALANEATYKKYGRLYTWDNVNTNLASLGLQGWRMPTRYDLKSLADIDPTGKKFRVKTFNNGTDDFGFSALPSGYYTTSTGVFSYLNDSAYFNSSSLAGTQGYFMRLNLLKNSMSVQAAGLSVAHSVRLVLDLNEDGSIPDGAVIIAEADESAVATLSEDGVAVASVEPSTDSES